MRTRTTQRCGTMLAAARGAATVTNQGGAPQVEGGPPHFVHAMFDELEVN